MKLTFDLGFDFDVSEVYGDVGNTTDFTFIAGCFSIIFNSIII